MFIIQASASSDTSIVLGFLCICCLAIPALVIYYIWKTGQDEKAKKRALQAAYVAYQQSLAQLKQNPSNADIKQHALQLGRYFSELTRKMSGQKGVTLFDEMALMNDINAACAAAYSVPAQNQPDQPAKAATPVADRLAKLAELRARGVINDEEYAQRRQNVLNEI